MQCRVPRWSDCRPRAAGQHPCNLALLQVQSPARGALLLALALAVRSGLAALPLRSALHAMR